MIDWSAFDDLDPSSPGPVVAVVGGGEVQAWRSFGAEAPGGAPLTPRTPFYVGSVAKQLTAACVAVLVLDGVVGLDDPVRRWLPEAPTSWDAIRLHHLVAHTGGLPDSAASPVTASSPRWRCRRAPSSTSPRPRS